MNIEENIERLRKVNSDEVLQGLIAQAEMRGIIFCSILLNKEKIFLPTLFKTET